MRSLVFLAGCLYDSFLVYPHHALKDWGRVIEWEVRRWKRR